LLIKDCPIAPDRRAADDAVQGFEPSPVALSNNLLQEGRRRVAVGRHGALIAPDLLPVLRDRPKVMGEAVLTKRMKTAEAV
jgi:hypothetical protein